MWCREVKYFFLIITVIACEKQEVTPREFPGIITRDITNISGEGATFNGEMHRNGNESVTDWGFVWDSERKPALEKSDHKTLMHQSGKRVLIYDVRSTLLPETTYYVRAFARSESYTVYGNEIAFVSKGSAGPEMLNFSPLKATWGDTLSIKGRHFSTRPLRNLVTMESIVADITDVSDSLLRIVVPSGLQKRQSHIYITVAGKTAVSDALFQLEGPKITDFNPKTGTVGDTVLISGERFSKDIAENIVRFDNFKASVVEANTRQIKVIVPSDLDMDESFVSVEISKTKHALNVPFSLTSPTIEKVIPGIAKPGDTITVRGNGFSIVGNLNKVFIDLKPCTVIKATKTTIAMIVPPPRDISLPVSPKRLYLIVAGKQSNSIEDFTYLAPEIVSLTPANVLFTDTLSITGENFSLYQDELTIQIDGKQASIIQFNNNELTFPMPKGVQSEHPRLQVITNSFVYTDENTLTVRKPFITNVDTDSVTFLDEITITANNLNPVENLNRVFLNGVETEIRDMTGSEITVTTPIEIQASDGSIDVTLYTGENALSALSGNAVQLKPPNILQLSPQEVGGPNIPVTITGRGFNPDPALNIVTYKQFTLNVLQASASELIVAIPDVSDYLSFVYTDVIQLECAGIHAVSTDSLKVSFSLMWTRKKDFPAQPRNNTAYFSLGNKGYICGGILSDGNGYTSELWEYDPAGDKWTRKANYPGEGRHQLISFIDDNFAYVGMGGGGSPGTDIWRYDPVTDVWTKITDFPSLNRLHPIVFSMNHKVYIGTGCPGYRTDAYTDCWEYNILLDTWTQKDSLPYFDKHINMRTYSAVLNGKAYSTVYSQKPWLYDGSYIGNATMMEYDETSDNWIHLNTPGGGTAHAVYDNLWYHINSKFAYFDPTGQDKWTYLPMPVDQLYGSILFEINGKLYYGLGTPSGMTSPTGTLWEIDLSKYP